MNPHDRVFLQHMLGALASIEAYTTQLDESGFLATPVIQDAVIRQIEILGEATKHLSRELRSSHKQVPWRQIAGMRDKLIHHYFGVDTRAVWHTVIHSLPELKRQLTGTLDEPNGQFDLVEH